MRGVHWPQQNTVTLDGNRFTIPVTATLLAVSNCTCLLFSLSFDPTSSSLASFTGRGAGSERGVGVGGGG